MSFRNTNFLVHDQTPAGPGHRRKDRCLVPRGHGAQVDQFHRNTLVGQALAGGLAGQQLAAPTDQGHLVTWPQDGGFAQGQLQVHVHRAGHAGPVCAISGLWLGGAGRRLRRTGGVAHHGAELIDRLAVGARYDDTGGSNRGAVYLFDGLGSSGAISTPPYATALRSGRLPP